ncbi:MAG: TIGR01906 family membrane protein [Peptococcaceae bacterium]|nr:TIGR01906 family membrane protein [Peptococcaceae bacterium]
MAKKKSSKKKKIVKNFTADKRTTEETTRTEDEGGAARDTSFSGSIRRSAGVFFATLCSLVLIVVLLLTSIEYNSFKTTFYQKEYTKLNSAETIGISQEELMQTTEGLLTYIKGKRADLDMEATINGEKRPVFNEREKAHMVDVRTLYFVERRMRALGIALFLMFMMFTFKLSGNQFVRNLAKGYLIAGSVCLVLFIFLITMILKDFSGFWMQFHYLFFNNDLWLLNPETDILIQMLPQQFFYDLVVRILGLFLVETIILAIMSGIGVKKLKPGKTAK